MNFFDQGHVMYNAPSLAKNGSQFASLGMFGAAEYGPRGEVLISAMDEYRASPSALQLPLVCGEGVVPLLHETHVLEAEASPI